MYKRQIQVYYIKSEILLLVLHCLHDDLEVITTLQDDILHHNLAYRQVDFSNNLVGTLAHCHSRISLINEMD